MYIYKKGSTEIAQTKHRGGLIGENFFRHPAEETSAPQVKSCWYGPECTLEEFYQATILVLLEGIQKL
jgi:hypothetical protein